MPDPEHMAQVHVEEEASRLSPPRGMQGLRRELESGTVRQQPKELRIKEVASQAPGGGLVSVMCIFPESSIFLLGLLAVSLMDNEREQANRTGRVVTGIWLRGPLALIEQSVGAWQCRVNCTEGWHCSLLVGDRPRAFRQGDKLSGVGESMAGSCFRDGDSVMLLHRRRGPVELRVRKLKRAFKEQEGARGKPCIAFRLAILGRCPPWMKGPCPASVSSFALVTHAKPLGARGLGGLPRRCERCPTSLPLLPQELPRLLQMLLIDDLPPRPEVAPPCDLHDTSLCEGSEKGGLQVEQDDGREEGPDTYRECEVGRERRERGILCRVGNPVTRGRAAKFTQEDLPPVMARFVQEAPAELKVLSMRAERSTWKPPPAVFSTVLVGEHLRHAGAVGTTEVEGGGCDHLGCHEGDRH